MKEIHEYRNFTKPAEVHKAVNTLQGILNGMKKNCSKLHSKIKSLNLHM